MELKQNVIQKQDHKWEARSQITIGDDCSVPEGKPDIGEILQKKAQIVIDEVPMEKGKIRIRGKLRVEVLYLTQRSEEALDCLEMEFPLDEILYMEGAASGDHLKVDWEIEELHISVIHPGKLSVRALVNLEGVIAGREEVCLTETLEEAPGIFCRCETISAAMPVSERKELFTMQDEILLPANKPNVQRILWKDLQLRGMDVRILEGRISVKGEALVFILYQTEEEPSKIQWIEQSLPFHGTVEAEDLTQEMYGMLEPRIAKQSIGLKPDYDGEMRMFQVELVLDLPMRLYREGNLCVLKDAYSTKERLELQTEPVCFWQLKRCNQANLRISGQETIGEDAQILQILGHQAQLCQKSKKVTDQGILCEGVLMVSVLYVTGSDQYPYGCTEIRIPYSRLIEIPKIKPEDAWKVFESVEQVYVSMSDSDRMEVRAALNLEACVLELCCVENVTAVTREPYDPEIYKNSPGMKIHFVKPEETLWTIAKENRTTTEQIRKINELSEVEVTTGQKLLLVKPAPQG